MTQTQPLTPLKPIWTPHDYQSKGVDFLLKNQYGALIFDPGLGKTTTTLEVMRQLKQRGGLGKVLLIAPKAVCLGVWTQEIEKFQQFEGLTCTILHGKFKEANVFLDKDIYIINPEGLDWFLSGYGKLLHPLGFTTLVIDELSKFKHSSSARFKILKKYLPKFTRRWGLTGSLASNGYMDVFGQMYMLDEGAALGKYLTSFRAKYFNRGYNGFSWTLKPGADEEINRAIAHLCFRASAKDHLNLPELINTTISVELPKTVRGLYRGVEKDFLACLGDKTILAPNKAAALSKCKQIANGAVYVASEIGLDGKPLTKEVHHLHSAKVDALEALVGELQGSPLLVGYEFAHDLDALLSRFGKDTPTIGGGTPTNKMLEIQDAWNAGKVPLLLGHPKSMGHGLNLQRAGNHVAWYSIPYDLELYQQFIRRVYRQGNTNGHMIVHHILAKGTVDEKILAVLTNKDTVQENLYEALSKSYAEAANGSN